jgi:uncharacterized peroxidase-related enzyme
MKNFNIYTIDTAPQESKALLENLQAGMGFVPNIFAVTAESSLALENLVCLNGAFAESQFSAQEQQIILLATSTENECVYCVAGHTTFAKQLDMAPSLVNDMRTKQSLEDPKLNALSTIVRQLVIHRGRIDDRVMDDFLAAGYTKAHFLELVLGICVKTFTNYVSNALTVPVDEQFEEFAWERPSSERLGLG